MLTSNAFMLRKWSLIMEGGICGIPKIACTQNMPPSKIEIYLAYWPWSVDFWNGGSARELKAEINIPHGRRKSQNWRPQFR